ncbi:unnamed protein product [Closterium sp. Naga37s-1]|nr:unnamed protein product [Closterium sp. Naga37s-1]
MSLQSPHPPRPSHPSSPTLPLPPFLSPTGRPQLGPRCAADRTYSLRFLKLLITEAERGARGEVWEELYPLYVDALGAGGGREKGGEGEEGDKGENGEEGEEVDEAEEGEAGHAVDGTPWCYHTYAFRLPPLSSCPPYPRLHASPSRCHASSHVDSSSHALTVRVSRDMLRGGTGCTAWPASLFLAEALLSHPPLLLPSFHRPSTHAPLTPTPTPSGSTQAQGAPTVAVSSAPQGAPEGPLSAPVCEEACPGNAPVCLELGAGCGLLGLCLAPLPLAKACACPGEDGGTREQAAWFGWCVKGRVCLAAERGEKKERGAGGRGDKGKRPLILTDASTASLANLCANLATNGLPFSSGPEIPLIRPSHPHGSKRTARPGQGAQLWARREEQRGRREEACEVTWSEGVSGMQECEGVRGGGRAGGEGGARVHVQQLCWEEVTPALASSLSADVIIGADIVYDPSVVPALADTLAALLSMSTHSARTEHTTWQDNHPAGVAQADPTQDTGIPDHATSSLPISLPPAPYALIASTRRNPLTMECFLQALHDRGLQVRDVAEELVPHSRSRPLSRWFHCLELPEADRMMLHLIHI